MARPSPRTRHRGLVICCALLTTVMGCDSGGPASTAAPAQFLAPVGQSVPPICTKANADKRFTFAGYVGLPKQLSVEEPSGEATLDVYAEGPYQGRSFGLAVVAEKQFKLETGAERLAPGFQASAADIVDGSFRLVTEGGEASDQDKVQFTVELEVIEHFQSHEITACVVHLVSAKQSG